MKTSTYIGALLTVLTLISIAWYFGRNAAQPYSEGFKIVSIGDNETLISNSDVLSYNWTSQEIAISDIASQRLLERGGNLYSFSGFTITLDGKTIYEGVFRMSAHSAIPGPPKISIMFPSVHFPSVTENCGAMRMFYPSFKPPNDQPEANALLYEHFRDEGKLLY